MNPKPTTRSSRRRHGDRLREGLKRVATWHLSESLEDLISQSIVDLHEVVGADATGWNEFDPSSGSLGIRAFPVDSPFLQDVDRLQERIAEHPLIPPLVAAPESPPLSFSDLLGPRELRRLPLYNEYFLPLGATNQMIFVFDVSPLRGIAFNRVRGDFSSGDREVAEAMRSHLRLAHRETVERIAARRAMAALEKGLEGAATPLVLVGRDGRIEHLTPKAAQILRRWFGSNGARLPSELEDLGGSRCFRGRDSELTVTCLREMTTLLALEERRLRADPARVAALGLTRRQGEVVELAGRGLGDGEIAIRLDISRRTVEKHLTNAYSKLGISGRRRAAAVLLGRSIESG